MTEAALSQALHWCFPHSSSTPFAVTIWLVIHGKLVSVGRGKLLSHAPVLPPYPVP